jgi:PhnB protein
MTIKKISPYLAFDGKAAKAIELYQRALGAKVESLMRFADAPATGHAVPESHKDRVMHAILRIGEEQLMVMDAPPGVSVPAASNVQVGLQLDDPAELTKRFDALAAGGAVRVAPHDAFWGAKFGMLTDAFGIQWLFNCPAKNGLHQSALDTDPTGRKMRPMPRKI